MWKKGVNMNEATIYAQIEKTTERIKNKDDVQEVIKDINEICENIYKLSLYHDYIEMMALFNKTYNTCLVASEKSR